jgi:hypothetical protein
MRRLTTSAATIPATVHFNRISTHGCIAALAREFRKRRQIAQGRQGKLILMMSQVAIVTEQNKVIDNIGATYALRHYVMILEAAMIVLLRLRSTTTQTTFEPVAQVDLKTGAIGKRHLPEEARLRVLRSAL